MENISEAEVASFLTGDGVKDDLEEKPNQDKEQLNFDMKADVVSVRGSASTDAGVKKMDEAVKPAMTIASTRCHSKSLMVIAAEVSVRAKESSSRRRF